MTAKRIHPPARLPLGFIADDYVLGIVAAKCGIVPLVTRQLRLRRGTDRRRLFALGVDEAHAYLLDDIARELWTMHRRAPRHFARVVGKSAPPAHYSAILQTIANYDPRRPAPTLAALEAMIQGVAR